MQAPPNAKLPPLYLLDSISKNIGEPYRTHFATHLAEIVNSAWAIGALHKPLEKLMTTWTGIFPDTILHDVHSSIMPSNGQPQVAVLSAVPQPMAPDPRLSVISNTQQTTNVSDLLSSLVNAGLLTGPVTTQPMQAEPAPSGPAGIVSNEQYPVDFVPGKIKADNPAAVGRLLHATEATRRTFLDRKFLKRQRIGNVQASRMWYVDVDTWMAGSMGATSVFNAQDTSSEQLLQVASKSTAKLEVTVPVDDTQTQCALSGEKFEQIWDSATQEWRYKGVRRLEEEEASHYGLDAGALVLVSALESAPPPLEVQLELPGSSIMARLLEDHALGKVTVADEGLEKKDDTSGPPEKKPRIQ